MATTLLGEARPGDGYLRSNNGMPSYAETWNYIVESDNEFENRANVILTAGLPQLNVTGSPSGLGVCRGIRCSRREGNTKIWDVTVEFSSDVADSISNADPQTDPETWIPIYEQKWERREKLVTKDINGAAFCNSAGQPFPNGLIRSHYLPVWEFFQLESAGVTDSQMIARQEKINLTPFRGLASNTLLLTVLSSVIGYYYGQPRRLSRYRMIYDQEEWTAKKQDTGTIHKNDAGTKWVDYFSDPEDTTSAIILGPLDGSGGRVTDFSGPATLEFDVYYELEFNDFLR